jgi:hypothetical protein
MIGRLAHRWVALAVTGAAVVSFLAMLSVRVPGSGPAPYSGAVVLVDLTAPQQWVFTTDRLGFAGLRLWLAEPPPPEATLTLTIFPASNLSQELASVAVPLTTMISDGAVDVSFAPLWLRDTPHMVTTTLVVRLEVDHPTGRQVVLQGAAEGGIPAFTPSYQVRPFDRVWPITSMAEGRTGLLGMPSFYALLAYSVLVALARMLWVLVHDAIAEPQARN